MNKTEIIDGLQKLIGADKIITDEQTLKVNSQDRYRKYQSVHNLYTMPQPSCVARAQNTADVVAILQFCNEHEVGVIPKTGGTATEGGLEV